MSDLDSEIELWQDSMIRRGVNTDSVEELERHLRDSFGALASSGEYDADTWREALDELGDSEEIAHEFLKVQDLERSQRFIRLATTLSTFGLIVGSLYGGYAVALVYSDSQASHRKMKKGLEDIL